MARRRPSLLLLVLLLLLAALAPGAWGGGPALPVSDHCDGARFFNPDPGARHSLADFLRWRVGRRAGQVRPRAITPAPAPPARVDQGLRATFVNHATVLLQMGGVNALTDPIWSERASPVAFAGPKRAAAPGLRFEDLPPIQLVLLSHNHYDHLDRPTLRRLARRDPALVLICPLNNRRCLQGLGLRRIIELDWWQSVEPLPGVRVTLVPARHFSGRSLGDYDLSLWGGFVLQAGGRAIYFAGDTAWGPHFAQIAQCFPRLDLALLPIGAFSPRWFMHDVHMDPEEAARAWSVLGPRACMAIHQGTFELGDDQDGEARGLFAQAMRLRGAPLEDAIAPENGESRVWR
jgi:L-ascorbate metabolism protein UlaG (beta-lactamase superfamily)